MGTDATASDSDRRWAEAGALLGDPQDEAILQNVRRRRRRMWVLFGAVMAGLVLIGVVAGFLIAAGDDDGSDAGSSSGPLWLHIVGVACSAAGLLTIVAYVIKASRAGLFRPGPLSALSWSQQRGLRRQVMGKEPVQSVHLPLLRHLAHRIVHQRNSAFLLAVGLLLNQSGSFLVSPELWRAASLVTLALLFLVVAVQVQREEQRAERFLAEHPDRPSV